MAVFCFDSVQKQHVATVKASPLAYGANILMDTKSYLPSLTLIKAGKHSAPSEQKAV